VKRIWPRAGHGSHIVSFIGTPAVRRSRRFGHSNDENCGLRSLKLPGCWSITTTQSAVGDTLLTIGQTEMQLCICYGSAQPS